jgi:hypothetical protein
MAVGTIVTEVFSKERFINQKRPGALLSPELLQDDLEGPVQEITEIFY